MSELGPGCVKTRTFWLSTRSGPRDPSHVRIASTPQHPECASPVSYCRQDVQSHFGADVLERFHLEVRRSYPRLHRAEGMLHSLAAHAHLVRISIEPRLHGLEDGFVFPTRDPALLASRALALQRARRTGGRPIAAQCLAVLLVCITIG